jgi:sec-independent protein translocase protein TatB
MGNFTASEILWILVIILIVFGPQRLPELARKAGALARKAREAVSNLTEELDQEYGETLNPLREVADELKSVRRDLRDTATSIARDVSGLNLPPKTSQAPAAESEEPAAPTTNGEGAPAPEEGPVDEEAS